MKKNWLSLLCLFGILFAFTAKIHADDTYLVICDLDQKEWNYYYTNNPPKSS